MRQVNVNVLSAADNQTTNGSTIDSNQLVSASFQAVFGDIQAAGTFKLQASNDVAPIQYSSNTTFIPTNWVNIPNQTTNVTSGASALLTIAQTSYRWLRAVYTSTATGAQTIVPVADVAGSLNNKYFLLSDGNSANLYYVWMNVNSAGVNPMIAGRTGVEIDLATGATAAAVGTALASAIDALATFVASGTTTVTVTNTASGPFTPMTDGLAPTGFTFAITAGGSTTVNVSMFALGI